MATISTNVFSIITSFFNNQVEQYTNIPQFKHIDDGIKILNTIGKFSKYVYDAWCLYPLYERMNSKQRAGFFEQHGIDELSFDSRSIALIHQFVKVKKSFTIHNVANNELDKFNIYIFCPMLKALLVTTFIQRYTDFSRGVGEGCFEQAPTDYVANYADFYNMWLDRVGVTNANVDVLVNAVSRLYPWSIPT